MLQVLLELMEGLLLLLYPLEWIETLNTLKKGRLRFVDLAMKRLSATSRPIKRRTSRTLFGGSISRMAWILSGLALIPRWETKVAQQLSGAYPERALFGVEMQSGPSQICKSFPQVGELVVLVPACDKKTINVSLQVPSDLGIKN